MTGSRGSQFLFRQVRSVLNKEVGFNPLASQRKVDNYIENIMVAKKEKVRTLPKPLSSHYDRLDLRIDYEGQKMKVKVKIRTLPQLLFSHYERLDLRIDKGQRVDSFLRQHTIWNRLQMVGNSPTLPRPY